MLSRNPYASTGYGLPADYYDSSSGSSGKRKRASSPPAVRQRSPQEKIEFTTQTSFEPKKRLSDEYRHDMRKLQYGRPDRREYFAQTSPRSILQQRSEQRCRQQPKRLFRPKTTEEKIYHQILQDEATARYVPPGPELQIQLNDPHDIRQHISLQDFWPRKDLDGLGSESWDEWVARKVYEGGWASWFLDPPAPPKPEGIVEYPRRPDADSSSQPLSKRHKLNSGRAPNTFIGMPSARWGVIPAATIDGVSELYNASGAIIPAVTRRGFRAVRSIPKAVGRFIGVKDEVAERWGIDVDSSSDSSEGSDADSSDGDDDDYTPRAQETGVPLPAPRPTSDILPDYLIPRQALKTNAAGEDGTTMQQGSGDQNVPWPNVILSVRRDTKVKPSSVPKIPRGTPEMTETVTKVKSKFPVQTVSGAGRGSQSMPRTKRSTHTVPVGRDTTVQPSSVPKNRDTPAKTAVNVKSMRPASPDLGDTVESYYKNSEVNTTSPTNAMLRRRDSAAVEYPVLDIPRITIAGTENAGNVNSKRPAQPDSGAAVRPSLMKSMFTITTQPSAPTLPTHQPTQSNQNYIIFPTCSSRHSTETTFCEHCGTPWPPKPAPKSEARSIMRNNPYPDTMHLPGSYLSPKYQKGPLDATLVTRAERKWWDIRQPDEEFDEEAFMMTGGAGPAGTLDVDGTPIYIPEEERERLLADKRMQEANFAAREHIAMRRKNFARLNGLNYPTSQPYFDELGSYVPTEQVRENTPEKPYIPEGECMTDTAQELLNNVAKLREEAVAQGRVFPEGITGWDEMGEAVQEHVRWATRLIEENERRSSSAADQATTQQQIPQIDKAFGFDAELQKLDDQRIRMLYDGYCWPEDLIGWAGYSDADRNLIWEATLYLEHKEAMEE
ncbi:hypothetical protein PtrSN002B_009426 [Pyrenophora tritici-repentis]|uniref:AF-4 multi-domain protein n=2 Tax=Pyrenophora tritici-repentis TaxID=45151 RepID=A0A2W1DG80_9PLEO|nr:uncharacterized protein PTRG_06738 [Pyrenophora tritici-repentis Pt-1C-BFP]KAA8613847.1 hypothetical protein PtrV1_12755 [Pyrenophora tritici-repentis]EDU49658.1 predicted protein [Pyrenophora tritici-repentis Pt-1C-BFP]KAF7445567.1 hypothetical protein A1F99_105530 [Pyrenophora tritici-repentis]KAF7565852.1 AF-4 multi-domain protein [Pyrenophora tritici-repentis]KAG9380056.1 hypothetical protein A1F94_008951 [Pyrenophora tritici-repentis]